MTVIFGEQDRRRRRRFPSSKTAKPDPVVQSQYEYASQSSIHLTPQASPDPMPVAPMQQHYTYSMSPPQPYNIPSNSPPMLHPGYSLTPQQHQVYGAMPQMVPQYPQPYGSPSLQPAQPYVGNSTLSFASYPPPTCPPPKEKENMLKSQWHKAERMTRRSYHNISEQFSAGVDKSTNMVNKSTAMLTTNCIERPSALISQKSTQALNQGAALCDLISTKLDAVITSIDGHNFSGKEQDLMVYDPPPYASSSNLEPEVTDRRLDNSVYPSSTNKKNEGSNVFAKVWAYSNSRLPPHLPPFKVYMPTYPLLCLAAAYSERAYTPPPSKNANQETETHIAADWRSGTKAMVLKSLPIDDMNTVVFAIRGSQTFMDWAVNSRSDPTSPEGFLDDGGNLCHAGFLYVARKMVKPVADRLRLLLQENPSRSNCSLLITGHSAGGAVAALLYAHMMNTRIESELNYLTGFFKRVHCITFGAPPVSLLPFKKSNEKRHKKSLFYSFINEGDPVPRADKQVVKSLLKLYARPAPNSICTNPLSSFSKLNLANSNSSQATFETTSTGQSTSKSGKSRKWSKSSKTSLQTSTSSASSAPDWPIPSCTLCPAGRLVVLRQKPGGGKDDVEAVTVDEEVLRRVVYGDPLKHMMRVYRKRVEGIAVKAVTVSEY